MKLEILIALGAGLAWPTATSFAATPGADELAIGSIFADRFESGDPLAILDKLGVGDRIQAALKARDPGLV